MTARYRTNSIGRRLAIRLLAIVSAIWLAAFAVLLWQDWDEINESYLGQAEHLAIAMAAAYSGVDGASLRGDPLPEPSWRRGASWRDGTSNFFVVVRRDGREIYRSANAPHDMLVAPKTGALLKTETEAWLLAVHSSATDGTQAVVGLAKGESLFFTAETASAVMLPMLFAFVLLVMGVLSTVRRGLAPVDKLHQQLVRRSPLQLDPVEIEGAPAELQPMITSLNRLFERLANALETERRFIANASHELRTPLSAIKAQIQAIDREAQPAEALSRLEKIHRGIDRSTRLIEQLLALSRAEAESADLKVSLTDLSEIARAELAEIYPKAMAKGVEIELGGEPAPALADPVEVSVLVRNLIENAVNYSDSGALAQVETGRAEGYSWLRIEDSGPGMSPEEMARAWEPFRRGENASGSGSGLGLSIAQAVAKRHGGTLELCRSKRLGGLCAFLRLPNQDGVRGLNT